MASTSAAPVADADHAGAHSLDSAVSRTKYYLASAHPVAVEPPEPSSDYDQIDAMTPLVIDNGATSIRAGWSTDSAPRVSTDNVCSKYRDRRINQAIVLPGKAAYLDHATRQNLKTPFEGDVVINHDHVETMLDYAFYQLGINSDSVAHPIVMTEALCNPQFSRSQTTELLFEGYGVPSVAYGVDSLFAFYNQSVASSLNDGLVVSSSTASTHVIPVLDGKGVLSSSKKLNWGGYHSADLMLKLMQLKYPTFPGQLNFHQAGLIYQDHCFHSLDYMEELRRLSRPETLVRNNRLVQMPFTAAVSYEKTQEELDRIAEKKKQASDRLKEQAQRQRTQRIEQLEKELEYYGNLRSRKDSMSSWDWEHLVRKNDFEGPDDLENYLADTERKLTRAKNKMMGIEEQETNEPPSFPLVDVPDHQLNEEDLREKRRQRLMKAGYDARMRMKAERDYTKTVKEEQRRRDEELRNSNFGAWLQQLRQKHLDAINRIEDRKKLKEQLADRRSLAAQNRMKSIANLADDQGASRKRRRVQEKDDGFGVNDSDWAVYREIGPADNSEDEEDDQENLRQIEAKLLEHDPNFTAENTAERQAMRRHALLNAFTRGLAPNDPFGTYDSDSPEHNTQLHVNIERIRVPEVLWQPHIGGMDQAGLAETIENILRSFTPSERDRLTKNVFVTGGNTLVPGFDERLRASMQPFLPVGSPLEIVRSADGFNAAWRGQALWSQNRERLQAGSVLRREYEEIGVECFRTHGLGNAM
ncbi:Nuclear actin-protein involved in chromatin remodeling [Microbotryomycetes sp. JL221]|nr:Nuclear actin-protein involved in chromatin remodeling [Microbotryomycetes sp. JL221]